MTTSIPRDPEGHNIYYVNFTWSTKININILFIIYHVQRTTHWTVFSKSYKISRFLRQNLKIVPTTIWS